MSVQSEIDRINGNVANTYSALSEMGATMPEQQNSDNLAQTARTVPVGGGSSVQSDWNQTDESAADFIKNRTHYETEAVILEEQELAFDADMGGCAGIALSPIEAGNTLTIVFDGVTYVCSAAFNTDLMSPVFGNLAFVGMDADSGEPFFGAYMNEMVMFITADEASHNVKVSATDVQKLDSKFYNGSTVFFTDETYLFTDAALLTKATKSDVEKAFSGGSVIVKHSFFAVAWQPVYLNCVSFSYAVVACMNKTGESFSNVYFYTAEYVPET